MVAVAFGFALRAFSDSLARLEHDRDQQYAVLIARSQLARVGHEIPLVDHIVAGEADHGFSWRIAIAPLGGAGGLLGHGVAVSVGWTEGRQRREVKLETVRLGPESPSP